MKVNVVKNDSETVIEVSGRVDATTAPELDTEVNKNIEGVKKLIFDFKDMEYISSAGLRVILS
ncbi:MAG: STAS domain-containing protein, partial [Enterococcus sp.]|nr:STAS domain-containing protein [Enterococcus sp.]